MFNLWSGGMAFLILFCSQVPTLVTSFLASSSLPTDRKLTVMASNTGNNNNPFRELSEMFRNLDDVIDDFMAKRMGNGEVFYGKRRYKPSERPNTDGKYDGMGLSDSAKIDERRLMRDIRMEELRRKKEAEE